MKKRFTAFVLAFIFVLSGCLTPAFGGSAAADTQLSFDLEKEIGTAVTDYVDQLGEFDDWAAVMYDVYGKPIDPSYISDARNEVKSNIEKFSITDLSRKILALTAAGQDVTDIEGINLLEKLANLNPSDFQFTNELAWTLIALDAGPYTLPQDANIFREFLIGELLKNQLSSGTSSGTWSWNNTDEFLDLDTTGMVLTALSPYKARDDVSQAVNKAIAALKNLHPDNSNSAAQVILGLVSVGIDPLSPDFNQGGKNLLEYLYSFKTDKGYKFKAPDPIGNAYSTRDAAFAYMAYQKFANGVTHHIFYGIKDATPSPNPGNGGAGGTKPGSGNPPQNKPPLPSGKITVDVTVTSNISHPGLPVSGEVELDEGATAYDALVALVGAGEVETSGSGSLLYVRAIKGLEEKEHGPMSGWTYRVNGKTPGQSAGSYKLKDGDDVVWQYTGEEDKNSGNSPANSGSGGNDGSGGARQPGGQPDGQSPAPGQPGAETGNGTSVDSDSPGGLAGFVDADKISEYAKEAVIKARELGFMVGKPTPDGKLAFDPKGKMTRAEFVTILMTMLYGDFEVPRVEGFKDVRSKDWFYKYVLKAKETGLVVGDGNGAFMPNRTITREEIAIILGKAFDIKAKVKEPVFSDVGLDNSPSVAYIYGMYENGIMVGYGGKFHPKDPVTREMAAVIMVGIYDLVRQPDQSES